MPLEQTPSVQARLVTAETDQQIPTAAHQSHTQEAAVVATGKPTPVEPEAVEVVAPELEQDEPLQTEPPISEAAVVEADTQLTRPEVPAVKASSS